MNYRYLRLRSPLRLVPQEYKRNFWLLFSDIAWFGVLSGSTIAFLTIYTAHIGARTEQIGLMNAAPPIVSLVFSLAFGAWMVGKSTRRVVLINAILMRIYYLPLIIIPVLLPFNAQVWVIIGMTFLMSIPGTGIQVGFTVFFGEAVPEEWRAFVAGARNAIFAILCIVTSLISGAILENMSFPRGYQLVFAIGFIGAVMSIVSLYFIHPLQPSIVSREFPASKPQSADNGGRFIRGAKPAQKILELPVVNRIHTAMHFNILSGPYGKVLILIFAFHLMQYLPIPLFPIFSVKVIQVSDQVISIANAIFYCFVFLVSTQLPKIVGKIGNQKTTGIGMMSLAVFPILLAVAQDQWLYLIANMFGGTGWGLASGAMYNYGLEKAPPHSTAPYLAWFTLCANAGMLLGALSGPILSGWIGIRWALAFFALIRFITGIVIARWN